MDKNAPTDTPIPDGQEEQPSLEGRYYVAAIVAAVLFFFVLTYPYRDIRIPSLVLASLAFLAILGLTAVSYFRPQLYWGSIAFCVYIPFSGKYPGAFGSELLGLNFTNILIIPVIVQWFRQRSQLNQPLFRFHAPDLPLLCFCFLSSISLLRVGIEAGGAPFLGELVRLKRWLFPFFLYFLFVNTARKETGVKHIVTAICVSLGAIAVLTIKESMDIGPGGTWDRIRVRGVLGNPNSIGAFFVYYTLLFLGLFLCYWRERRGVWLLLIPFLLCGRAMTLANSRGGMIAFTLAILATLFVRSRILFALAVGGLVLAFNFPQYLPETISGRLFSTIRVKTAPDYANSAFEDGYDSLARRLDASSQGRRRIWMAGWNMFWHKPWLGFGYGQFPEQVARFGMDGTFDAFLVGRDPHNAFLGIATEMGAVALFFFVLTLLMILRSCLNVYRRAPDLFMRSVGLAGVGMMMGVISANLFGSRFDTAELTAYLWILSAIIAQYDRSLRLKARTERRGSDVIVVDPWKRAAQTD